MGSINGFWVYLVKCIRNFSSFLVLVYVESCDEVRYVGIVSGGS